MASVNPSKQGNVLIRTAKTLVLQPILFIKALPYVTAQLSAFGVRFVRRPVVWAALGAHGILMLLPAVDLTAQNPEEIAEPELEEPPVIEVQNLSDLIGTVPEEVEPPPPPEPEEPPTPETTAPPSVEQAVITDVEDIPEDLPPEEPPDESFSDDPLPDDPLPDDPLPSFDRSGAQQQASSRARELGETTPPAPLLLDENQWDFFFNMSAGNKLEAPLVQGLTDLIAFNDATLAEKEQEILDSFINGGDQPIPAGEYGGWPLYQLVDAETGEEVGYLSILQGTGGRTVLVGIWDIRP